MSDETEKTRAMDDSDPMCDLGLRHSQHPHPHECEFPATPKAADLSSVHTLRFMVACLSQLPDGWLVKEADGVRVGRVVRERVEGRDFIGVCWNMNPSRNVEYGGDHVVDAIISTGEANA